MQRILTPAYIALCLTACASAPSDLPVGWEAAELVADFSQRPCSGSTLESTLGELTATAAPGGIAVAWDHAQFQCEQDVEAYARRGTDSIDILVQPVDIRSDAVAGCSCLYDISMEVPATRRDYELTLYRRWDVEAATKEIGRAEVSVE